MVLVNKDSSVHGFTADNVFSFSVSGITSDVTADIEQ